MDNRIEKDIKTAGIILGSTGAAAAVSYLTTRFFNENGNGSRDA